MRIWIKAVLITIVIALTVLYFQSIWFFAGKEIVFTEQDSTAANKPLPELTMVNLLKDSLFVSTNSKKYSNFALRLSNIYSINGSYDSAALYKELIAIRFPNEENWESAGLMYFKAFENALGEDEEQILATKAIDCLEKGLSPTSPTNVKIAIAKLYIASEEPQKAEVLLKEVLMNDAANKEALYLMGIRLFQLNKFDKAGEYLSQLVKIDSSNINGMYYLAIVKVELGNSKEAKALLKKLKLLDISEEVEANVDEYLNDIK